MATTDTKPGTGKEHGTPEDLKAQAKEADKAKATDAPKRKAVDLMGLFSRAEREIEKADGPLHAKAIQKKLRLEDGPAHALYVAMLRDAEKSDAKFVKTKPGYFDMKKLNRAGKEVPYKSPTQTAREKEQKKDTAKKENEKAASTGQKPEPVAA